MSVQLTPGLTLSKSYEVRKRRELPVEGEILVQKGSAVKGDTIVARAQLAGELIILRLPERMGIQATEVMDGLKVKEGEQVSHGQVLAEHSGFFGLFRTVFQCPDTGVIEFISEKTGHVGLRLPPIPLTLSAYASGTVVEVEEGKALTILSHSTYVQGIFGVGGERFGTLRTLPVQPNEQLEVKHLPDDCSGLILAGGFAPTHETLIALAERGAKGLVTGSLDDTALREYLGYDLGIALTGDEDIPMTIMLTEGFGAMPLSPIAWELLSQMNEREVSLNGATQVRAGAVRPEVFALNSEKEQKEDSLTKEPARVLKPGVRIRFIRVPSFGEFGVVTELPEKAEVLQTGAKTRVLRAQLDSGESVTVPRANVEIVDALR